MRMDESVMPGSRESPEQDFKSLSSSQRGFTQRKHGKSKPAGFPFLDEVTGCRKEIEKMKVS